MARGALYHHAVEAFATYLRVERNLAPRTRRAYVYDLQRFGEWLADKTGQKETSLDRIPRDHLINYLTHLRDTLAYKAATMNRVVSSLRVFFQFCVEEKLLEVNPAEDLRRPKLPQRLPVYLLREELLKLFDAPNRSEPAGRRDYAILITLAYTGLRLQELVGLNTTDIDFPRAVLRVFGKGRKERLVPMNETVALALRDMLEDPDRLVVDGERAVFLNQRGRRLSGRAVQYLVDRYVIQAGISREHISPHKLRHTFATLLYGNDVDLVDIQSLMGHASLTSTQIYTHTNTGRLQSAIDRLRAPGDD